MSSTDARTADGRNLRRDRNRQAVVAALLELYREGDLRPSSDAIAARAGISARSLFRYFDDIDALVMTAIEQQQAHLQPLYAVPVGPQDPLGPRVERFVEARVRLLEAMGPVGRVARSHAIDRPALDAELRRIRAVLRDQVAAVFAPELAERAGDGDATLAALDVALSWETYHLLRDDQRRNRPDATAVMVLAVRRLLGADA